MLTLYDTMASMEIGYGQKDPDLGSLESSSSMLVLVGKFKVRRSNTGKEDDVDTTCQNSMAWVLSLLLPTSPSPFLLPVAGRQRFSTTETLPHRV